MPAVAVKDRASQSTEWKRFLPSTTARAEPMSRTARPQKAAISRVTPPGPPYWWRASWPRVPWPRELRPWRARPARPWEGSACRGDRCPSPTTARTGARSCGADPCRGGARVGRAYLHAELAELAGVELQGEDLGVVALLRLQHLDLDHLGRADVLAEPAADAVLLARLLVVGQSEHDPKTVGIDALHLGIVHGDGLA